MRIAVTGRNGQVARALQEAARAAGDIVLLPVDRPGLDLARPETILPALRAVGPDAIVSAAAYTAVDKAESEPDAAFAVNRDGAGAVADAAAMLGVPVVHLSTDYVYDGRKSSPYLESDATAPVNVYGTSKLAGEMLVKRHADHAILRTTWVYDAEGRNFVTTMLRVALSQPTVRVVDDQRGAPTGADDIAAAILSISRRLLKSTDPALRGTFHLQAGGSASWADVAAAIFEMAARLGLPTATVERIATADYPTPAQRPLNSQLDTSLIERVHGVRLPDWQIALGRCLERIAKSRTTAETEARRA